MTTEEVIERVRKLLRMANGRGASSAEAEAAADIARELLNKHGLSLEQVEALRDDPTAVVEESEQTAWLRAPAWAVALAGRIGLGFDCELLIASGGGNRASLLFVGLVQDAAVARYLYRAVAADLARAARKSADECGCRGRVRREWIEAFLIKAAIQIGKRLSESRRDPQAGALIECKKRMVEDHLRVQEIKPLQSTLNPKSRHGYYAGAAYGDAVCVRTDVLPQSKEVPAASLLEYAS